LTSKITRNELYSRLRDKYPDFYFTADDAVTVAGTGEESKRAIQMALSRLVEDGLLARPKRGIYAIRRAEIGYEQTKQQPTLPKVRRIS